MFQNNNQNGVILFDSKIDIKIITKFISITAKQPSNLNMEAWKRIFSLLLVNVFVYIQYIGLKYS